MRVSSADILPAVKLAGPEVIIINEPQCIKLLPPFCKPRLWWLLQEWLYLLLRSVYLYISPTHTDCSAPRQIYWLFFHRHNLDPNLAVGLRTCKQLKGWRVSPGVTGSFLIFSVTISSTFCRIRAASSTLSGSVRIVSMASNLSPENRDRAPLNWMVNRGRSILVYEIHQ